MIDYLLIFACVLTETVHQLLYRAAGRRPQQQVLLIGCGIFVFFIEQTCWYLLLNRNAMGVILPLTGASYATIALASYWCFGEKINRRRWMGIACILLGVAIVSRYIDL